MGDAVAVGDGGVFISQVYAGDAVVFGDAIFGPSAKLRAFQCVHRGGHAQNQSLLWIPDLP